MEEDLVEEPAPEEDTAPDAPDEGGVELEEEESEPETDEEDDGASGSLSLGASADTGAGVETDADAEGDMNGEGPDWKKSGEPGDRSTFKSFKGVRDDDGLYFGWDVGLEWDVGYADYRFSAESEPPETFNDARGQVWLTPVFEYRFGKDEQAFLRGSAEFIAWFREQQNQYKTNVFEAYVQVGVKDIFDVQGGRLMLWRMAEPGAGFDIYTLEDTGCLTAPGIEGENFCAKRYEVDDMWLVDTPNRLSIHAFPLKKVLPDEWNDLGLEFTIQYGKSGRSNNFGKRAVIIYDTQWARAAGGWENQSTQQAEKIFADVTTGELCDDCSKKYGYGLGGSVVVRPPFLEGGFNYADRSKNGYTLAGVQEAAEKSDTTTQGGYVELHTGHLLASAKKTPGLTWMSDMRNENIRQITLGYGHRRTEHIVGNGDFEVHTQRALYIKYNLGFANSSVKFVLSKSDSGQYNLVSAEGAAPEYSLRESDMLAGRFRFATYF